MLFLGFKTWISKFLLFLNSDCQDDARMMVSAHWRGRMMPGWCPLPEISSTPVTAEAGWCQDDHEKENLRPHKLPTLIVTLCAQKWFNHNENPTKYEIKKLMETGQHLIKSMKTLWKSITVLKNKKCNERVWDSMRNMTSQCKSLRIDDRKYRRGKRGESKRRGQGRMIQDDRWWQGVLAEQDDDRMMARWREPMAVW